MFTCCEICRENWALVSNKQCPVCLEETKTTDLRYRWCGHYLCVRCYFKTTKDPCPLCRANFSAADETEVETNIDDIAEQLIVDTQFLAMMNGRLASMGRRAFFEGVSSESSDDEPEEPEYENEASPGYISNLLANGKTPLAPYNSNPTTIMRFGNGAYHPIKAGEPRNPQALAREGEIRCAHVTIAGEYRSYQCIALATVQSWGQWHCNAHIFPHEAHLEIMTNNVYEVELLVQTRIESCACSFCSIIGDCCFVGCKGPLYTAQCRGCCLGHCTRTTHSPTNVQCAGIPNDYDYSNIVINLREPHAGQCEATMEAPLERIGNTPDGQYSRGAGTYRCRNKIHVEGLHVWPFEAHFIYSIPEQTRQRHFSNCDCMYCNTHRMVEANNLRAMRP